MRLEKVQFLVSRWFLKLIFVHSFKGVNAGCCLLAACLLLACCLLAACLLLLACCCLPACLLLLACCLLLLLLAAACCCLLLLAAACCCLLLLAAACCLLACWLACWLAGLLACSLLACCLLACLLLACCCLLLLAAAAACLPGWIGQQTFWELSTTLMHIAPAIDLAAENKGPRNSPANRIIALPIGFATANPFALQEIWGCTNRGLMWSRDAGHQYNIFKSNRNSCREFVCINLCPSKSLLCAMLRLLLTKSLIIDESGCAMVILLPWCDFPLPDVYRRGAMGMMWLFPHDVTWARRSYYVLFAEVVPAYLTFSLHGGNVPLVIPLTYLFWMGGTFVFFIWWFGMKKGCGGAGSSALHVVVNDGPGSCAWQLMNQGSFGGRSGVVRGVVRVVSFVFFVCSFFYLRFLSHRLLLLLFSLFPSFTQFYSFSNQTIVAEWLFVMQSSAGRRVVCSARGGLSRVCYNGTLMYFVSFKWRQSPCVLMDCCNPAVTRSWRLFRKRFVHIQENCSDFSPRL